MTKAGSLVCVGVGMTLGSHLTPLCRSYIEQADIVFTGLSDGIIELWLAKMNPDVRSLQSFYREGKPRTQTYREMVDAMLTEVRAGKKVCGAFYGHPGVFAWPPHKAIEIARQEGFQAHMEPGVSAEDCLYADLGIDPGTVGCQHYEANQIMFYRRRIDPSAYLVLWQVGVAGDQSSARFSTGAAYRQVLLDVLARDYDLDHEVIVYRGATLPIHPPRIDRLTLRQLPQTDLDMHVTLVIPPARALQPDPEIRERLAALDRCSAQAIVFDTPRLYTRLLSEEDEPFYCGLYTSPDTMQIIASPLSPARARQAFRNALKMELQIPRRLRILAIVDKATQAMAGICSLRCIGSSGRKVEAGMMFANQWRAKGYGTEIFTGLVQHAFRTTSVTEVIAVSRKNHSGILSGIGFARCDDPAVPPVAGTPRPWSINRESWSARAIRSEPAQIKTAQT